MASPSPAGGAPPKKQGVKIKNGDRVIVTGFVGTVRFIGTTKFAADKWVGVELDKPEGKNDGSVKGVRYFNCPPKHGIFAKPNLIRPYNPGAPASEGDEGTAEFDDDPEPSAPATTAPAPTTQPAPTTTASPAPAAVGAPKPKDKPQPAPQNLNERLEDLKAKKAQAKLEGEAKDEEEKKPAPAATKPAPAATKPTGNEEKPKPSGATASAPATTGSSTAHAPASKPAPAAHTESGHEKKLAEDLAAAQKEIEKLRKLVKDAEEKTKDLVSLKKALAESQELVTVLKSAKDVQDESIAELSEMVDTVSKELESTRAELDELQSKKAYDVDSALRNLPKDQAALARVTEEKAQLTDLLRKLHVKYEDEKLAAAEYKAESELKLAELKAKADKLAQVEDQIADYKLTIEELRASLDASSDYEKMVEDLTEKNLTLNEENKLMKEKLENFEELNESHVELENSLQAEVDSKEMELQECHRQLKIKQSVIEDLNATQRQFKDLVKGLEAEARELRLAQENAQGLSRDESERARRARIANLQLQARVSEVRIKSVEHMVSQLEASQAQTQFGFYASHIPDNVNIDQGSMAFLLTLDRLVYKSNAIAKLLAESYGLNTHNESLSQFTYSLCSKLSDLGKAAETLRHCVRKSTSEDLFTRLVSERDTLRSPEAALDQLLNAVTSDSFNESTSIDGITAAEENVNAFIASYFMGDEDDRGNRKLKVNAPLTISYDATKLHYQQGLVVTYFQGVSDLLNIIPKKEGKDHAFQAVLEELSLVVQGNSELASKLINQASSFQLLASRKAVAASVFESDVKYCNSNIFACLVRVKQLWEWANGLVKQGVDENNETQVVEQVNARLATETAERRLLAELTNAQRALRDLAQKLDKSPEGSEEERVVPVWEKRAGDVRKELLQAASLQSALEESTKKIDEKTRELFLAQRKLREAEAKAEVLSQKLEVAQGRADDTTEMRGELDKLKKKVTELEAANDAATKDMAQTTEANKTLRKKVLKLKYELKQAQEARPTAGSGGSSRGGEGFALLSGKGDEISLLLRTIAALRSKIATLRAANTRYNLKHTLPPLPVVNGHVVHAAASHSVAENVAVETQSASVATGSFFTPRRPAEIQEIQKLGEELANLNTKVSNFKTTATLVDVSIADPQQNKPVKQWLSRQEEAAQLKASADEVRGKVHAFLASRQGEAFRSLYTTVPAPGSALVGATSGKLIGKISVPLPANALPSNPDALKTVVTRHDFAQLHSIFVQ